METEKKTKKVDYHRFTKIDMPVAERRRLDVGDIWLNRAQCLNCKEIIVSNNRHDYKYCKCGKIFVDGGSWYGRMGGDLKFLKPMVVYFNFLENDKDKPRTEKRPD